MLLQRQFLRFVAAGATSVVANFLSRLAFSRWMDYPYAVALAYTIGMAVAFALMRRFVFDAAGRAMGPQLLRFSAVNAWGFVQTIAVSLALARWALPALGVVRYAEEIGHFASLSLLTLTSYALHRIATFR